MLKFLLFLGAGGCEAVAFVGVGAKVWVCGGREEGCCECDCGCCGDWKFVWFSIGLVLWIVFHKSIEYKLLPSRDERTVNRRRISEFSAAHNTRFQDIK